MPALPAKLSPPWAFHQWLPLTSSICSHLTAHLLSGFLTGHADGPEARWHPDHAPCSLWGSASGTDVRASHPTCQTATDNLGFPTNEPENLKARAQPHATLSCFYIWSWCLRIQLCCWWNEIFCCSRLNKNRNRSGSKKPVTPLGEHISFAPVLLAVVS